MAEPALPSRVEAIKILEQGRARTLDLIEGLARADLLRPGIGGGTWSAKDLLGHLASWEEYGLDALAAWERGERAPIDDLQFTLSTGRINAQSVERKASWPLARVRRESSRTHAELIAAIRALTDARWRLPATQRGRRPLGRRLGGILGGPAGLFRHDAAHHPSLGEFVEVRTGAQTRRAPSSRRRSNA